MISLTIIVLILMDYGDCWLWPKGVVHYAINGNDYDPHSQDVISSTFTRMEREICVKFFYTPVNHTATKPERVIYITNPNKKKDCPPITYNFTASVIEFPIGYKCLNEKEIAIMVVDMLKATLQNDVVRQFESADVLRQFAELGHGPNDPFLISAANRDLINTHYYHECSNLIQRTGLSARRSDDLDLPIDQLSPETLRYYAKVTWPLGVVMYTVDSDLRGTHDHTLLKEAMTTIELSSCIVFQYVDLSGGEVLTPKNALMFGERDGEPAFGFKEGHQHINLERMVHGARGHTAHTLNLLFRALGIPMMSNRFDRDNYVLVNWRNVIKGKEHFFEKTSEDAWLRHIPYDFDSVTHAPGNFLCQACDLGARTVEPIQDLLWQRTLTIGHKTVLSETDVQTLRLIYGRECARRYQHGENDVKID